MSDLVPEEASDAAWIAVASVRDASPRRPDDADTGEVVAAALSAAAPLILAAGFERLADEIAAEQDSSRFGGGSFGSGIQRAALAAHRAASVLRGEGPQ